MQFAGVREVVESRTLCGVRLLGGLVVEFGGVGRPDDGGEGTDPVGLGGETDVGAESVVEVLRGAVVAAFVARGGAEGVHWSDPFFVFVADVWNIGGMNSGCLLYTS
ncbi:MAG: hypothetical protein MPK62_09420, partial [Alphaproteobacteria bacterium]|nr:hypothetical protein [Alphaproteobacteria bacterium]